MREIHDASRIRFAVWKSPRSLWDHSRLCRRLFERNASTSSKTTKNGHWSLGYSLATGTRACYTIRIKKTRDNLLHKRHCVPRTIRNLYNYGRGTCSVSFVYSRHERSTKPRFFCSSIKRSFKL